MCVTGVEKDVCVCVCVCVCGPSVDIAQFTYHNNCAEHVVRQEERQEVCVLDTSH